MAYKYDVLLRIIYILYDAAQTHKVCENTPFRILYKAYKYIEHPTRNFKYYSCFVLNAHAKQWTMLRRPSTTLENLFRTNNASATAANKDFNPSSQQKQNKTEQNNYARTHSAAQTLPYNLYNFEVGCARIYKNLHHNG